ncbi:MAG: TonB-dependent receptor [Desulfobacterales bacterium]|nr:TonB-dependent receptor [Desulfobacterales bacterium]
MNIRFKTKRLIAATAIAFYLGTPFSASAEEAELETITVTANKTEENVREVPISMTVLSDVTLEDAKIESVKDIADLTPNLMLFEHPGLGVATTMRGISADPNLGNSVAMFVDGVPVLGLWGFDETLMDIERVEVLRGPQGTLYGKEAEAGVINVITRAPDNTFRAKVSGDLGSDAKRTAGGTLSGPIIKDRLFAGISGKYYTKDGYIYNSYQDRNKNDREYGYGKLFVRATPSDHLSFDLVSSYTDNDSGGTDTNSMTADDPNIVQSNLTEFDKSTTASHSLKARYDTGSFVVENITAYRKHKNDVQNDWDFTQATVMHGIGRQDTWRLSNEFRVSGDTGRLKWLTGLYADNDVYEGLLVIDSSVPGFASTAYRELGGRSLGVFGSLTWAFTEKLSLTAGTRFDWDEKTFEEAARDIDLKNDYSAFSPKVALQYAVTESHMVYGTVSRGYRSGGFSPIAPEGLEPYDKETVTNFEIGSKHGWLNNRLTANLSLFYMDIDDMQVTAAHTASRVYVSNAAEASSYGLETELAWRVFQPVTLFASLGLTKSEFDEFSDAQGDYSGNTNILVPNLNFNTGVQYRDERGIFARVDLNGVGRTYLDKDNTNKRDAYFLVNAKAGYEADHYDIYLYARNALDETYNAVGYFGAYTVVSPPRELGIQMNYRF